MKKSAKLTTKSKSTNSQSTTDFVYGWFTDMVAKRKTALVRDFAKNPSPNFFDTIQSVRIAEVKTVANQVKITFHLPDLDTEDRIAIYRMSESVSGLTSLDDFYSEFFKLRAVSAMENDEEFEQAKLISMVNRDILPNGTTVEMLCEKVQHTDNRTGRTYWTHKFPINKLVAKIYSIVEQSDFVIDGNEKLINTRPDSLMSKFQSQHKFNLRTMCEYEMKARLSADGTLLSALTTSRKVVSKTTTVKTVESANDNSTASRFDLADI
jgi:hypothetical protein